MITTRSKFYFIDGIELSNRFLNFDDGTGEVTAELISSNYSPTELSNEVARAMTSVGDQEYACTFDRTTRKYTISADANFDLLPATGSNAGLSVFSLIGFTLDKAGANSYEGDEIAGYEYNPQVVFQDYEDDENNKEGIEASVNESADGSVVETVTFGNKSFVQFNIKYITDFKFPLGHAIESNPDALANARFFMDFAIEKNRMELMKDRDTVSSFITVLLDKTPESGTGTGYKLKEIRPLKDIFETGKLKFRKLS